MPQDSTRFCATATTVCKTPGSISWQPTGGTQHGLHCSRKNVETTVEGNIAIEKAEGKGEYRGSKGQDRSRQKEGENGSGKRENCCQEAKGWWGEGWEYEEKKVNT